ncbi:hypothetical protein EWM64_g865 [Hericium alpestre]|uniref:Uncharacterized protein n=1 Tax=Hericium alpestre TaxID=135208 RepID=A0A4Z0AC02_9AGAM|nr:hypothetical protein EWM64_g865 [Hericium alpestre]
MASTDTVIERSYYIGLILGAMLYGLELYIFFQSIYCLLTRSSRRQHTLFYIAYSVIMLLLLTIAVATDSVLGQLMWIEHRDIPGGPPAYLQQSLTTWWQTLGSTADLASNVLGDGLLLYRCYMVWGSRLSIVALPFLVYLGSFVLSIFTIIESVSPGSNIVKGATISFEVPYMALSVGLNIIVTLLISSRLFMMRRQIAKVMAPELANTYTNIIAILVESAAPLAIAGILAIIFIQRESPVLYTFVQLWGAVCVLSPQFIILRVAMGEAWSRETISRFSRLSGPPVFAPNISGTVDSSQTHIARNAERRTESEKLDGMPNGLSQSVTVFDV